MYDEVSTTMRTVCLEIEKRYNIHYLEIVLDDNHLHFLIQSVSIISAKKIINSPKSVTGKEIFRLYPEVKSRLWGGEFWSSGYYVNTVDQYANEDLIKKYLQKQGKSNYKKNYMRTNYGCSDTSYALLRGSSLPNDNKESTRCL